MRTAAVSLICFGLLLGACSTAPDDEHFKEGKWSITTKTEIIGSTMQIPVKTSNLCLSAQERIPMKLDSQDGCTLIHEHAEGETVSWQYQCKVSKGNGTVTYNGNHFSGEVQMQLGKVSMTSTMTGKYLGPCK